MRTLFFTVLFLLLPTVALADPPSPTPLVPIPAGEDNIVAVKKGDPAPFEGQLFDQSTAIRWANFLQQARVRLLMDPMYQYRVDQVEIDGLKKTLDVEKKKYDETVTELNMKLAQAQQDSASPPFYKTFWFGATIGIVVTTALAVSAAVLVSSVR